MKDLSLTVIIPSYNRKDILKKCLNALFDQTYPRSDYEIIVVDDGSTDGTEEIVKFLINRSPCILQYFKQENKGPAVARNLAIKNANARIVLFIGDDIIATPGLVTEHMKWHSRNPEENVAILGYVTWSPELRITPFMKWLENGGPQFCFHGLEGKETASYKQFYTSNISLKRHFLLRNGLFDEDFKYAAYEDVELAYRLKTIGLKIEYNPRAIGFHYHPTSIADACKRMRKAGESGAIFVSKHPELEFISVMEKNLRIKQRKKAFVKLLYPLANVLNIRRVTHKYYTFKMGEMLVQGYRGANHEN